MTEGLTERTGIIEWAVESRLYPGQTECGDRFVVLEVWEGVLVAVVDGLGHGAEAAFAANSAIDTIRQNRERSFSSLLQICHENLRGTRGVVISLAFLDPHRTMTWIGIGDVEGRLVRRRIRQAEKSESLLLRTGVVGGDHNKLPSFYPRGATLVRGDILILATDGIRTSFEEAVDISLEPGEIALDIINNYSRIDDDSLVLVARYMG